MLTREKNRGGIALEPVQKGIKKHIAWLERQLADVEADLDARNRRSPVWAGKNDLLRSVPGWVPISLALVTGNFRRFRRIPQLDLNLTLAEARRGPK